MIKTSLRVLFLLSILAALSFVYFHPNVLARLTQESFYFSLDIKETWDNLKERLNKIFRRSVKPAVKARDTLILKNGNMIQGVILTETPEKVTIRIDEGTVGFARPEIAEVRKGETLVKDESGIAVLQTGSAEGSEKYPRLFLKNGNIVSGDGLLKEADMFYLKQSLEGGGTISHGFKKDEVEKIRLWKPPAEAKIPKRLIFFANANTKFRYQKPPYHIFSSAEASDATLYFSAMQKLYDDFIFQFFDLIDPKRPHEALLVVLFGDYGQFLSFLGLPSGTNIQGLFSQDLNTLFIYNVKAIDLVDFHLRYSEAVQNRVGQVLSKIEQVQADASSGKWAAYDFFEKISNNVESYRMNLEAWARTRTIETVRHELTHQLMFALGFEPKKSYRGAWLSEGLAQYMEPEDLGSVNKNRLMQLKIDQDEGGLLMPLSHLISFKSGTDVHARVHANYALSFYSQSWAFVYFLMKNYQPGFWSYLKALQAQGKDFDAAKDKALLENCLGKPLAGIEKEWETHTKTLLRDNLTPEEVMDYKIRLAKSQRQGRK